MLNQLKPPDMGYICADEQKACWISTFETLAASTMITILLAIGLLGTSGNLATSGNDH